MHDTQSWLRYSDPLLTATVACEMTLIFSVERRLCGFINHESRQLKSHNYSVSLIVANSYVDVGHQIESAEVCLR